MRIKDIFSFVYKQINTVEFWKKQGVTIGENCSINASVSIISEPYLVKFGDHVRVCDGVKFITHDGGVWVARELYDMPDIDIMGRIEIGSNVHIGTNAIIMPGVTIGDNCIIGCAAVVTKDIPSNSIAVGIPARPIKTVEEYVSKNSSRFSHTKAMSPDEKRRYCEEYLK